MVHGDKQPEPPISTIENVEGLNTTGETTTQSAVADNDSAAREENARVHKRVEQEMEFYNKGEYSCFQASTHVANELGKWAGASDKEKGKAFDSYLAKINSQRMKSDLIPEQLPSLLARLMQPDNNPMEREFEMKLRNSWIRYLEKLSTEMLMDTNSDLNQYGREPERRTCLGSTPPSTLAEGLAASRPVELYSNSVKTFRESNHSYESLMASRGNPIHSMGPDPMRRICRPQPDPLCHALCPT